MPELYRGGAPVSPDAIYRVAKTTARPLTLLPGHDPAWQVAQRITWGPREYLTGFRALWHADGLALRFDAWDDRPWHTMRRRDDPIWEEEVVEIFLDPARLGRDYAEVEISPFNVVTDLHIVEPHPRLRGERAWNWSGLESTVVPGSCSGMAAGSWAALAWLPWTGLSTLSAAVAARVPPATGDVWAFNVFRIKRPHGPSEPERDAVFAAWSVPSGPSFHDPDAFRRMEFSSESG